MSRRAPLPRVARAFQPAPGGRLESLPQTTRVADALLRVPAAALLLAFAAAPLLAQAVAVTPRGSIAVAHDGIVELYDATGRNRIREASGVTTPETIVTSDKQIAVLDPIANRVAVVDLDSGKSAVLATGETPIAAVFAGGALYVLDRDARMLERISPLGARGAIDLAADPAFVREANGRLYVYSRLAGSLQEVTLAPFAVSRTTAIEPFASDLEVDGRTAYLVYPSGQMGYDAASAPGRALHRGTRGLIRTVDLESMQPASEVPVGSTPVALALASAPNAITPRMLAVADPAAKRVWLVEGEQSVAKAFARGFLRGLLGLNAFQQTDSKFETGVDRLSIDGNSWIAYDSSSGTLYRFSRRKTDVLARGIAPNAFTAIPGGAAWWQNGTLVAQMGNR